MNLTHTRHRALEWFFRQVKWRFLFLHAHLADLVAPLLIDGLNRNRYNEADGHVAVSANRRKLRVMQP